jgi:hypothetical protein
VGFFDWTLLDASAHAIGVNEGAERVRPSIEERADKRRRLQGSGRDRFGNLVYALRAGREMPFYGRRAERLRWHPIAWRLVKLIALIAVVYALAWVASEYWRAQRVDTWQGPDTAVTSGQRLDGCARANTVHDDYLPSWIRYNGRTYLLTDAAWPVLGQGARDATGQIETGYELGDRRLLTPNTTAPGEPTRVLIVRPPTYVASVYVYAAECG